MMNLKVNFKILYLIRFFNFEKKFGFFLAKTEWEKIPHISSFGISTQIITNYTILNKKIDNNPSYFLVSNVA